MTRRAGPRHDEDSIEQQLVSCTRVGMSTLMTPTKARSFHRERNERKSESALRVKRSNVGAVVVVAPVGSCIGTWHATHSCVR